MTILPKPSITFDLDASRIESLRNRLRQEWRYVQHAWVGPVRAYFDDAAIRERRRTAMMDRIHRENIKRGQHAAMTTLGNHIAAATPHRSA